MSTFVFQSGRGHLLPLRVRESLLTWPKGEENPDRQNPWTYHRRKRPPITKTGVMTGAHFAGSNVRRCLARCVKMACSGMNLGVSWQSGTETNTARAPLPSVQNGRHLLGFRITSCATMSHTILCREQENPYLTKTYLVRTP